MEEEVFLDELVGFMEGTAPEEKASITKKVIDRLMAGSLGEGEFYVLTSCEGFRMTKEITGITLLEQFTGNSMELSSRIFQSMNEKGSDSITILFYSGDAKIMASAALGKLGIEVYNLLGIVTLDASEIRLHQLKKSPQPYK